MLVQNYTYILNKDLWKLRQTQYNKSVFNACEVAKPRLLGKLAQIAVAVANQPIRHKVGTRHNSHRAHTAHVRYFSHRVFVFFCETQPSSIQRLSTG